MQTIEVANKQRCKGLILQITNQSTKQEIKNSESNN